MTKGDLAAAVALRREITQADAAVLVDVIFDPETGIIAQALLRGEEVKLHGFGVFGTMQRSARDGHNPKTGKKIKIEASRVVKFRAGSNLRKHVNG